MALDGKESKMESSNVSQVLLLDNSSNQKSHGAVCMIGMVYMKYLTPSLGLTAAAAFAVKTSLQHLASSLTQLYLVVVYEHHG